MQDTRVGMSQRNACVVLCALRIRLSDGNSLVMTGCSDLPQGRGPSARSDMVAPLAIAGELRPPRGATGASPESIGDGSRRGTRLTSRGDARENGLRISYPAYRYHYRPIPLYPVAWRCWLRGDTYCERVIGSIRRDAFDQVSVLNERHLRRILRTYVGYYHHWRTHLSLEMDVPESRAVQPPELAPIRKRPEVGGLHHH